MIRTEELVHEYVRRDEEGEISGTFRAVDGVTLEANRGEFIAILGHNGSGKSTLAKHLNALLAPTEGTVWVCGMDTKDEEKLWDIRAAAGMVFQNPDNQIIATVVEEDVGFGPENLGVPTEDIWKRVEESLQAVGMLAYRRHSPNKLSGGQKQRVAVAGILAMKPQCIVLDEPTAMLDPNGRKEVIATVRRLNREEGITVILITHYMDEVIDTDRVFVMNEGKIAMQGTPREVFSEVDELKGLGLDVPQVTEIAWELRKQGIPMPKGILTISEFTEAYLAAVKQKNVQALGAAPKGTFDARIPCDESPRSEEMAGALQLSQVSYCYGAGTAYETYALKNISLVFPKGQFVGLIGHTGSGKSTLIQHLNGLEKPTAGKVLYNGEDIHADGYSRKELRGKVGLVFQYPEHQLFETTVFRDVAFGPKNQGLQTEEVNARVREALALVRIPEDVWEASPLELSGGQKRRVAIAGVLAMHPEVLVLDEPTAGLDPKGRDEILEEISAIHQKTNMTVILVSHSMEDVARFADRLIVLNHGEVAFDAAPQEVFRHVEALEAIGLAAPQVAYAMRELRARGLAVSEDITTVEQAVAKLSHIN